LDVALFFGEHRFIAHDGFSLYYPVAYRRSYHHICGLPLLLRMFPWLIAIRSLLIAIISLLIAIIRLLVAMIPLLIAFAYCCYSFAYRYSTARL
jgi:hypothetical protein